MNIKFYLLILAVIITAGTFYYTQDLVKELQNSERQIVELYANSLQFIADPSTNTNEDFTFVGASSKIITFDQSGGHIRFLDNAKAQFGTQGDLEIYHDGSNNFIADIGAGYLGIRSNNTYITKSASD